MVYLISPHCLHDTAGIWNSQIKRNLIILRVHFYVTRLDIQAFVVPVVYDTFSQ